jgi:hypothetical protein
LEQVFTFFWRSDVSDTQIIYVLQLGCKSKII